MNPLCESLDLCVGVHWEKKNKSKSESKRYRNICILYLFSMEEVWVLCICEFLYLSACCIYWFNHIFKASQYHLTRRLVAANKDTNESLDFISQSAWQSSHSTQSGSGAQQPVEEPMCTKPFRGPAIQLRQLFFCSTVDAEINVLLDSSDQL